MTTYELSAGVYNTVIASDSRFKLRLLHRLTVGNGWSYIFVLLQDGQPDKTFWSLAAACRAYDQITEGSLEAARDAK